MVSRNAIKYQPFSPLDGYFDSLNDKNENLTHVNKPILSEDDYVRINNNINEVIKNDLTATFFIYKNKRISTISSKVRKISNKQMYLEEDIVNLDDVINIVI